MGHLEDLYCRATDSLVQAKKFYPVKIPVPHHQLRHFISTTENDRIYYAVHHDVYVLNPRVGQISLVATVPFEARCLAADHGWVCVGGEVDGNCAFIKIERGQPVDNAGQALGAPKCFGHSVMLRELGGEIVNSMKIVKFTKNHTSDETEVAVLISNNDKSLKIYSLTRQRTLSTLEHSVPINYATLSPNSTLLVAVGDANEAYFYRREDGFYNNPQKPGLSSSAEWRWSLIGAPAVPFSETVTEDFGFSATFSDCGRLCAVSSQGGMISIFDVEALQALTSDVSIERTILCSFKSSRQPMFGCVRSMAFSPDPWGLLAWAEDHGRVGIADVRQQFVRRQIMKLELRAGDDVIKVDVDDVTPSKYKHLDYKDRLRHQDLERSRAEQTPDAVAGRAMDETAEAWAQEARRWQQQRDLLTYHQGLDLNPQERSVLEALETTMDDVQHSSMLSSDVPNGQVSPTSSTPLSTDMEQDQDQDQDQGQMSSGRPMANPLRDEDSAYSRSSRYHAPRRRTSVILSPSSANLAPPRSASRSRLTASPSRMANHEDEARSYHHLPPLMSTNDLTPSPHGSNSQPLPYDIVPAPILDHQSNITGAIVTAVQPPAFTPISRVAHEERVEAEREAEYQAILRRRIAGEPSSSMETSALTTAQIANRSMLRRHEENRRRHLAHIESLEREVHRTELRVVTASSEIETLEGERQARILEARFQARARAAANAPTNGPQPTRNTSTRRSTAEIREHYRLNAGNTNPASAGDTRTEHPPRTTELAGRLGRVSENDVRLARMMIISGARQSMDRNGNWLSVAREAQSHDVSVRENASSVSTLIEDAVREMGPGTAGVGWSPDGRYLYAGTEAGIFEYKVNMLDRMQFPSCEMR